MRRARKFMEKKEFNEVRLELEGVPGEEAAALLARARAELVLINLSEAAAQSSSSHGGEAHAALERARVFGATPAQLESARKGRPPGRAG
ncbi:MAG: hypothetical protein ABIO70_03815 [Pseudomonadota bacterium]